MAIEFHPLPLDAFPMAAQPYIARLNVELSDLFALEGAMKNPLLSKRSDDSIVRRSEPQVHVTRVTPDMTHVVSGASTVVGTPNLTLGTVNTVGSTTTALSVNSAVAVFGTQVPAALAATAAVGTSAFAARADHVHLFPTTLRSTANATTLTLTDDGAQQTLSPSLALQILMPESATFSVAPSTVTAPTNTMQVTMRPGLGSRACLTSGVATAGDVSGATVSAWNVENTYGGATYTGAALCGYRLQTLTAAPSSSSDTANRMYGMRMDTISILNANGGWSEVASNYFSAPVRGIATPTVSLAANSILECPTISGTTQIGLYVKQRTAQTTATNRAGIWVDAQNSGTNRWAAWLGNRTHVENPSGQVTDVLELDQLNTGAAAGAHIAFNDKAGDPPSPVTGTLWRNGNSLNFRRSADTVDLAAAAGGGISSNEIFLDFGTRELTFV